MFWVCLDLDQGLYL